ncbi:unnamed protein product [Phytophthora fragariaefolia]|uniref:Unnamed protein product n=1 Tax=Phytophthora fragariaefolia TaxID=1490495 RepID=A0A9W6XK59_9STRA|nr:unnamed protein product [Phytophthora fragariaefolia]
MLPTLPDEEVEEEEEEESPEDTPMENVSRDGSPPQDPFSFVPQAASPKQVSSAVAGLLSLDEAMGQFLAGVMPAPHTGPSGIQDVVPTHQVYPPKMASCSHCFIVGVPATTRVYRDGKYVQDDYGGVEALKLFEGLSEQDLDDLGTLFAQDGEENRSIYDLILRPHSAGPPPLVTLEAELNSLFVRQEVASLLRQSPRNVLPSGSVAIGPDPASCSSTSRRGTQPSSSWKTWLQTEPGDEPYTTSSPYTPPTPKGDGQGDDRGSDQESKSEDRPPHEIAFKACRHGAVSSLRTPTKRSTPANSRRGSSSKKSIRPPNQGLQLRPTHHKRGQVGCRSAVKPLERTVDEACKSLLVFTTWQDIRPDVQVVLRAGLDYPRARQLVSEGRSVHQLFPLRDLLTMLASMMYWNKLDDTPWTKFVPNSYFLQAEVLLDAMVKKDTIPSKWPPLEDGAEEQFSLSSDEHDEPEDQDYDDAAERAASAPVVQRNVLVLDVKSDEGEAIPPSRRPSAIKRARLSSDNCSGEATTLLTKSSSLPATSAQPQRLPPSKKRKSRVYRELIAKKPWKTMWRNRIKVLYFHRRSELTAAELKLLDMLMEYIHEHRQVFWEVLHWVIMKTKAIEGDDEDSSDYTGSVELYQDRTARHESVGRQMGLRLPKLISKGLPPSIFQEPGIWTYPCMVWYRFVKDPSAIQDREPRTLGTEQCEELEQDEPGRNQWWSCTEGPCLVHIPADLKAKPIPALERDLISERFP